MSRIRTYNGLLIYLNRVVPANGRPIGWQSQRITGVASEVIKQLGGPVCDFAAQGFELKQTKPKPGSYQGTALVFTLRVGKTAPKEFTVAYPS